ncbi:hypothetical protein [Vibrio parahaemolyticus]|uniref:hypothetical protein n=1 Tax=Vibrio parahaemolyticus TaxID=670 RepID=UPI0024937FC4|nr:hypothetical protein [Vibrio parahaemolyticus]HBB9985833.1 hypothetical protein [Vibrio parahaemolyticus]
MTNTKIIALSSILTFLSPITMADKPDWAGKGKPNLEEISTASDLKQVERQLDEQGDELEDLIEEKKKKAKKTKNKKDKKKLERELEKLEVQQDEIDDLKEKVKSKKSGFEKQKAKKADQVQNELGKGSEQGQEKREENSKKWWKFWE